MIRVLSLILLSYSLTSCQEEAPDADLNDKNKSSNEETVDLTCEVKTPFALVELFTSQGCSSCPSAERTFNTMARSDDREVIYLANHVTYWNGPLPGPCGVTAWEDPYGKKEFTDRQQKLGAALGSKSLVTPWIAVTSKYCTFTSDNEKKISLVAYAINEKIEEQLASKPEAGIVLKQDSLNTEKNIVRVEYATLDADSSHDIHFVLHESGLITEVTAGENCNKTLSSERVSRTWITTKARGHGFIDIKLPESAMVENCSISAFIQDPVNQSIAGGTKGFKLEQ